MNYLTDIHWHNVHYWYVSLACVFSLILLRSWYEYTVCKNIYAFSGSDVKTLVGNFSLSRRAFKYFLFCIASIVLGLGLLRPCWGKKEETIQQTGRDIIIAMDVSRSMLSHDIKPNRLAAAKNKVKKLLHYLPADRVALLIFAGSAVVQCPLTTDYAAFEMFLDNLDAQTISGGTTAIDQALKKALDVFKNDYAKKTKLVVLFTDGEDFSSNLSAIKSEVIRNGLTLFTVGVGTENGAPVPIINEKGEHEGFEKDSNGSVVMSRLNPGILKVLAQESGGHYITAADNDADMATIASAVSTHEKESFENKHAVEWNEYTYVAATAALVMLILEWIL